MDIWQQCFHQTDDHISAVYIHLPFCFHKCHYCDFYSIVDRSPARHNQLVDRLLGELEYFEQRGDLPAWKPETLFLGGGTPTFLYPDSLKRLMTVLQGRSWAGGLQEITVEANPETLTDQVAEILAGAGVNRLSIGAQSFNPDLLKTLERWHDPDSVLRAFQAAAQAGITNLNVDLIFGIPGQTLGMVKEDLDRALSLSPRPAHISHYSLTYEAGTAMTKRLELGRFTPLGQDEIADQYALIRKRLADEGFEQYEISNWAMPGRCCRHNLMYWTNRNWLGLGPGASSHIAGRRWKNEPHLGRYLTSTGQPPAVDEEQVGPETAAGERLMLGLRLREGMPVALVDQLLDTDADRREAFNHLHDIGMLEQVADRYRLTEQALFVSDSVLSKLV